MKKNIFLIILSILLISSTVFWWKSFGDFEINNDAAQYHEAAVSLLADHSYSLDGELSMMREPGYSYFIFLVYKIFGVNPVAVRLTQVFLYFLVVLITFYLAGKFFNNFTARLSSLTMAIYPIFNIYTSRLLSEILACFLLMLFLLMFYQADIKRKYYLYAISGLILGCFVLTKSAFILVAPIIFLFIVFYPAEKRFFENFKMAAVFILFFSLIVAPWMGRNYVNFGQISLTSRAGNMIYTRALKNTYDKDTVKKYVISSLSGEYIVRRFVAPNYVFEHDYIRKTLLREFINKRVDAPETMNYDQIDTEMKNEGFKLIKSQPFKYLAFGLIEISNLNSPMIYYERHISIFHDNIYSHTTLKILIIILFRLSWYLFVFMVAYAIYKIFREKKFLVFVPVLFILEINFVLFFIQGNPRFLMPIFPIYIVLAAYSLNLFLNNNKLNRIYEKIVHNNSRV
ncbi:MAG: glycosyltransferase family 39 protein [bacterium]